MQNDIQLPLNVNHENKSATVENRHSDEIDDIITRVPSWILRWGIVLFSGILFMVLSISAIIRYPDTIKVPIRFEAGINQKTLQQLTGVTQIAENDITKIKLNQRVIIRLKMYPAEEFGALTGHIIYVAEEPDTRRLFTLKVCLNNNGISKSFQLKKWMTGDAEIITQDVTILQRITRNLIGRIK